MQNDIFKKIAQYQYSSEAFIFKGKLEAEGIEVLCETIILLIAIRL